MKNPLLKVMRERDIHVRGGSWYNTTLFVKVRDSFFYDVTDEDDRLGLRLFRTKG